MPEQLIPAPQHHTGTRMPCAVCGTRVFTYATLRNEAGVPLAHYCTMCANRVNGIPICGLCQRPVSYSADGLWFHTDQDSRRWKYKHEARPER